MPGGLCCQVDDVQPHGNKQATQARERQEAEERAQKERQERRERRREKATRSTAQIQHSYSVNQAAEAWHLPPADPPSEPAATRAEDQAFLKPRAKPHPDIAPKAVRPKRGGLVVQPDETQPWRGNGSPSAAHDVVMPSYILGPARPVAQFGGGEFIQSKHERVELPGMVD
eukprot:TRINITY_DN61210_c0_g1_i1.p1 TRINITY_DN61210_c0_g1~~TRINITY_DN61210_c0_g1_i1.p1  ORF type:complete len:184 (+),score=12.07 TRINITY_DN61210_c0_g1_i1:41-553(+)